MGAKERERPFGYHRLTPEAQALLTRPDFGQDELTDGPVAQRFIPGVSPQRPGGREPDLFDAEPEAPAAPQPELFE